MNLFDRLIEDIFSRRPELLSLRPVVEKEVLHHDILREMSRGGFLRDLTFIGGTCLRNCFGSLRLSEDLVFTGGQQFKVSDLCDLGKVLKQTIAERYGLDVKVSDPQQENGDTRTWKLSVITKPEQPHLPMQRIHIDVCTVFSYERIPVMLKNHYQLEPGTSGLILFAETREEILADKLIAFSLRNRVKQRDVWDIVWLVQNTTAVRVDLVANKLKERKIEKTDFISISQQRLKDLEYGKKDFEYEMRRFLPQDIVQNTIEQPYYWEALQNLLKDTVALLKF